MTKSNCGIRTISHLAFNVTNMEKSLSFYCDGFGFRKKGMLFYEAFENILLEKKQAMEKEYGAQGQEVHPALAKYEYLLQKLAPKRELPWLIYLEIVPGQFLELFYPREKMITVEGLTDGDVVRAGYAHLSLEVEDIKAAVENLASKGILPTSEITFGPDFTYQCWFEDPDGNRIELMQYTDKSLQVVGTKIVEN